ncbi:MAG: tetratricopeptide repeat protein, partial [Myxococcales bacterium]|nr:tetratricopeptide repeat protein [Myxococcales bacterium]
YGFALYKQAWCYYNMSEWQEALRKFKATVFYSELAEELSGENKIALGREAQKDFVRTYSHVGDDKRAKFVFADLLGEDDCKSEKCLTLLEQLAGLWFDEGYFSESAALYRQLIGGRSGYTKNPFYQGRVVDLTARGGDKKKVINETRKLVELYRETQAKAGADEKAKEHLEEARVLAETTMRRLAQIWNREAKKTRNDETYGYARTMYEDYLGLFGDTKYAYEMTFQLGDLYYKLERFDDAAKAFTDALAIFERVYGDSHPDIADSLNNLGATLDEVRRLDEAVTAYERALAIRREQLGEHHPAVAATLDNLAYTQAKLGDLDGAMAAMKEAEAILVAAHGREHPAVATNLLDQASVARQRGELAEAARIAAEARAIYEGTSGGDHPDVAFALIEEVTALTLAGRPEEAIDLARRAVEIRSREGLSPLLAAEARLRLGQAMWLAGRDRPAAKAMIMAERAAFSEIPGEVEKLDAWLAENGLAPPG